MMAVKKEIKKPEKSIRKAAAKIAKVKPGKKVKTPASPAGEEKVVKITKVVKETKKGKAAKKIHPVKSDKVGAKQFNRAKTEKTPVRNAAHSTAGGEKEAPVKAEKKTHEKPARKDVTTSGRYSYAIGRRKTSMAQVRLFKAGNATDNDLIINGKKFKEYFPTASLQNNFLAPLEAVGMQGKVHLTVVVKGGGVTGQVEAVRLGVSRALVEMDAALKKTLKNLGLLTRDSRKVERKKAGLKKARKAPQWAKR